MRSSGIDSTIICLHDKGQDAKLVAGGQFARLRAAFYTFAERVLAKALTKKSGVLFSPQWFGRTVVHHPLVREANIVHLHWINDGFLSPKFLAQLDELDKPVIWTFYDSNAFTGGCHDPQGCEHYHKECGFCPLLKMNGKNDFSHQTWLRKKNAYSALNCHIITSDQQIADSVKLSSLMGFRSVTVIPEPVPAEIFKPYLKAGAKKILRIDPDKFVLMTNAALLQNYSGTHHLSAALKDLAGRPGINVSGIEMVIIGECPANELPDFPFKTTFLGAITNKEHLSKCYAAADVFIAPALQDQLQPGILESLSCATPVVGFETTGMLQVIRHLENGYLAECGSAEDLATGIEWLYHDENAPDIQKEARRTILTQFSESVIAEKHLLLYQSLIDLQPK